MNKVERFNFIVKKLERLREEALHAKRKRGTNMEELAAAAVINMLVEQSTIVISHLELLRKYILEENVNKWSIQKKYNLL